MNSLNQAPPREEKQSTLFMNPLIKKLNKVEERSSEHAASYGGIALKTCFFMLWAVVGIASFFAFRPLLQTGGYIPMDNGINIYFTESIVALVALLISFLAPLLAFIIKPLVPVLGVVYCLTFGYTVAWLGGVFAEEFMPLIIMAAAITVLLVALMAVLYATGIVKVNKKFRSVITVLFFTMIASSILGVIFSFIPGFRDIILFVQQNIGLSVAASVIYIIIACLFLLVDFDTIQRTVQNQLPKKYEWIAAFGLAYTIFYLFLKIFDLLLKLKGSD